MKKRRIKKLFEHFTCKRILAAVFIIFIVCMGLTAIPATLANVRLNMVNEEVNFVTVRNEIDAEYIQMLGFDGSVIKNKGSYINLNGLMARFMGQRLMNERVKLDNGNLAYFTYPIDVWPYANQMIRLHNKQTDRGKDFLFIVAPCKVPKHEDIIPSGFADYSNENANDLLDILMANDVPVLDLREELYIDGINYSDAFFVTDHHWKPETGFWAYTKIIDYFEKRNLIEPIDQMYTDINSYNIDIREDWFLGSAGTRTGIYFAGTDDFSIIYPKFNTEMSLQIPDINLSKQGAFEDVALDWESDVKDYFVANPYTLYGYYNHGMKNYRNETAPIKKKVLFIGDSFACVTCSFLPLTISTLDQLDMRLFETDFQEYYYEFDPDIIIVMVEPEMLGEGVIRYNFFPRE